MRPQKTILALAAAFGLAACGDTVGQQAAIGAGAGVATAAILDGNLVAGAIVGTGANLVFCQVNPEKC